MKEIFQLKYDPESSGTSRIKASRGDEVCGVLEFEQAMDGSRNFTINHLNSVIRRQGVATQLLRKMVNEVGSGAGIKSAVTHDETRAGIERLGYFDHARTNLGEEIAITERTVIDNLPIVKVLTAGGIFIEKITVAFEHDDAGDQFYVFADGITDPQGTYRATALERQPSE